MTEAVPPTTPAAPVTQAQTPPQQQGTPLPPAPVTQAPPALEAPPRPVTLNGVVLPQPKMPETQQQPQEVRIRTPQGEITVKTPVPLPAGTEVSVMLFMQKSALQAAITVLKHQMDISKNVEQLIRPAKTEPPPPPPQLKAGDVVTALKLPDSALPPPVAPRATPLPAPMEEFLKQLKPADLARLPLPPEAIKKIMSEPATALNVLNALPPATREKIISLLPELLPKSAPQDARPAQTPPPVYTPEDPAEPGLLNILRARIGAKITQEILQTPAPQGRPPEPQKSGLGVLLQLVEQLIPQEASARESAPLPQNMFRLKLAHVAPPGTQAPPAPPQALEGEVESLTPSGHPVIRTKEGHFVLQAPADIAPRSTVIFEATPMKPQEILRMIAGAPTPAVTPDDAALDPLMDRTWAALQEALKTAPPATAALLRDTLPATQPQQMPPAALLFLAALRHGDIESWLGGGTMQALRGSGKRGLAERLTGDFGKLSAQAREALPGDWKLISMPLMHDGAINQMQFFVRRQHDDQKKDGDEKTPPDTRFLLNVSLNRLGDMQLDGLIRKKHFDMILRTQAPLSSGARYEITQRFADALGQTGMQGGMSFQVKRQGWVTVEPPAPRGTTA